MRYSAYQAVCPRLLFRISCGPCLCRVVKLPMTAFHPNLKPPVGFDQGDEFADLHSAQFTPGILDLRKKMRCSMAMHVLRAQSARPAPGPIQRSAAIPPLLPRRLLEHFRPVPGQELRMRQAFVALRLNQAGAVVSEQLRFGVVAAP